MLKENRSFGYEFLKSNAKVDAVIVWNDAEKKRGERGFLRNFTMLRILKRGILTLLLQRLKTC